MRTAGKTPAIAFFFSFPPIFPKETRLKAKVTCKSWSSPGVPRENPASDRMVRHKAQFFVLRGKGNASKNAAWFCRYRYFRNSVLPHAFSRSAGQNENCRNIAQSAAFFAIKHPRQHCCLCRKKDASRPGVSAASRRPAKRRRHYPCRIRHDNNIFASQQPGRCFRQSANSPRKLAAGSCALPATA